MSPSAQLALHILSPSATPSPPASESWSDRFASRYRCVPDASLADWFNGEVWKLTGGTGYDIAVIPDVWAADSPESIWPGLMTCDLIPILGNRAGDWLCIRVGADNRASQIVQWYHGGGDWITWGSQSDNGLAQAIVFAAIESRLPGPDRRHAIPADDWSEDEWSEDEHPRQAETTNDPATDPFLAWALQHVPREVAELFSDTDASGADVAETLIRHSVAETAVRCQLVQAALQPEAWQYLVSELASACGIDRQTWVRGLLDPDTFTAQQRQRIESATQAFAPDSFSSAAQDWEAAEAHAVAVTRSEPTACWAWDIAGYAAVRRGEKNLAVQRFSQGVNASVYSDQSIRLHTHWMSDHAAKFSAGQLQVLAPEMVAKSDYLQSLIGDDDSSRAQQAARLWLTQAERLAKRGSATMAVDGFVAAGWDVGMQPISAFGDLLDRIAQSSAAAGQTARQAVAATHRQCLRDRYGI